MELQTPRSRSRAALVPPAHLGRALLCRKGPCPALPLPRGDRSVQQCLPQPTGHLNLQQPQAHPRQGQQHQPCPTQSPPRASETAVPEASINSTFCLLFLIIRFLHSPGYVPNIPNIICYILCLTQIQVFPLSPELTKATRSCSYIFPTHPNPSPVPFPTPGARV